MRLIRCAVLEVSLIEIVLTPKEEVKTKIFLFRLSDFVTRQDEVDSMLDFLGLHSVDDLFAEIPAPVRKKNTKIHGKSGEYAVVKDAKSAASINTWNQYINFLGSGYYDRIVPSSVDSIISRSEFITSYTPYQPEVSQGLLQALFEYQSIMSDLTGMDVTNSSMYDGHTALGEAVRMAHGVNGKSRVLVPSNISSTKLSVILNYTAGLNTRIEKYRISDKTGYLDMDHLNALVGDDVSAIVTENPNAYGILDPNVASVSDIKKGALLISYFDPVSLALVKPPGEFGADIAVGEGQQLGIHLNYGGPYLGIFSFRREHMRKSPGRLIGETTDTNGKRAYVMTLQTREQHIRREKATSNICTNQALMAIAALSYLAILGPSGLKAVAASTMENSRKLRNEVTSRVKNSSAPFSGTNFSDVVLTLGKGEPEVAASLKRNMILGGIPLNRILSSPDPQRAHDFVFSVTEKTDNVQIERLISALEAI